MGKDDQLTTENATAAQAKIQQKLNIELKDAKDKSTSLEEAIQDVQVEKEDLELENQDLASKLADLTTQAKNMLLNNESLEQAITDQQIEYEDRIIELENLLEHEHKSA